MLRLLACSLTLMLVLSLPAWGEDPLPPSAGMPPSAARLRAVAALQLAKVAREREIASKSANPFACLDDVDAAKKKAKAESLPLFVWIGGCDEEARTKIDEAGIRAVHCHAKEWMGNATPRLVIPDAEGSAWDLPRGRIDPATVKAIVTRPRTLVVPQFAPKTSSLLDPSECRT